jgi:hypothetical protein
MTVDEFVALVEDEVLRYLPQGNVIYVDDPVSENGKYMFGIILDGKKLMYKGYDVEEKLATPYMAKTLGIRTANLFRDALGLIVIDRI